MAEEGVGEEVAREMLSLELRGVVDKIDLDKVDPTKWSLSDNPFSDLAYDPTQPRDEKGRWTGIGGGLASRGGVVGRAAAPPGVRDSVWDAWMRQTIERRGGPPAIPVSQHFMTAPRTSRHVKKELQNTLDAIDAVHADGLLPEVMVTEEWLGSGQEAVYEGIDTPTPIISLSREGFVPETSLAHEIGHLIDHKGLGEPQGPVSSLFDFATMADNDRRVSEVMDAINDTPEVRRLKTNDGLDERVVLSGDTYAAYLDRPYEKFARAYAQYISTKSQHPVLRNMMRQEQDESAYELLPRQWAPENFGAISEAFDALFRSKGWLNE